MTPRQVNPFLGFQKPKKSSKRIVLATFGTFGDLHPYMAIAIALRSRGHQAAIATSEGYRHKIESQSLEFYPVRPDGSSHSEQEWEFMQLLSSCHPAIDYGVCYLLMPHLRASYSDLKSAVQGADLLLTHPLAFVGSLVAQTTGIPWVSSVLAPSSLMSAYDSPQALRVPMTPYEQAMRSVANDAYLRHFRWQARFLSAPFRQLSAELGLPPSPDPFFEGQHGTNLALALFSQVLASPQPDWMPQIRIAGFPFYDPPDGKALSPELEEFLQTGPPPIVFTLGSFFVLMAGNFYWEGALAAKQLGYRAVLLMGQAAPKFPPQQLPEGVMAVDYAPYSAIFPRSAVIVHHGGIGTTGQALRAGRPMLVIPYAFDQPDNAARLVRLGVARLLERHDYTTQRVAAELKHLLFEPNYAAKATEVGRLVRSEDGASSVCEAIEAYLQD